MVQTQHQDSLESDLSCYGHEVPQPRIWPIFLSLREHLYFLVFMTTTSQIATEEEKNLFLLAHGLRIQSIMAWKACWEKLFSAYLHLDGGQSRHETESEAGCNPQDPCLRNLIPVYRPPPKGFTISPNRTTSYGPWVGPHKPIGIVYNQTTTTFILANITVGLRRAARWPQALEQVLCGLDWEQQK